MNIVFQHTSPGLSERLAGIGIKLKSDYMYKYFPGKKDYKLFPAGKFMPGERNIIHSYSIAELGLMIPFGLFQQGKIMKQPGGSWMYTAIDGRNYTYGLEVEARGFYLLDLIVNNQVTIDDVNNPQLLNRPKKSDAK